jgi:hypothetical protein
MGMFVLDQQILLQRSLWGRNESNFVSSAQAGRNITVTRLNDQFAVFIERSRAGSGPAPIRICGGQNRV